jgi:ADP-ribose pyrophosphatase YjhB (NUDIX family)
MKHRIRAAGLLVDGDSVLLIKHTHRGKSFWVPPGGGLEPNDENTYDTIRREVKEESNLDVEAFGPLVYIREFAEQSAGTYHVEQFRLVTKWSGTISLEGLKGLGGDEFMITEARFVSREEMADITLYPAELRDDLWGRLQEPSISAVHLGMTGEHDGNDF